MDVQFVPQVRLDVQDRGSDPHHVIRVVVFDDHVLMRMGVEPMLARVPFVQTLAITECLAELEQVLIRRTADVLLLSSGEAPSARDAFLMARPFHMPTLVLSRSDAPEHLQIALRAEATGHLFGSTFDAADMARALQHVAGLPATESSSASRSTKSVLTAREQRILALVVDGRSDREIAQEIGIQPNSAKKAVALVRAKLRCRNRAELVACALKEGWLPRPAAAEPRFMLRPSAGGLQRGVLRTGGIRRVRERSEVVG